MSIGSALHPNNTNVAYGKMAKPHASAAMTLKFELGVMFCYYCVKNKITNPRNQIENVGFCFFRMFPKLINGTMALFIRGPGPPLQGGGPGSEWGQLNCPADGRYN